MSGLSRTWLGVVVCIRFCLWQVLWLSDASFCEAVALSKVVEVRLSFLFYDVVAHSLGELNPGKAPHTQE
jgi:hypothetical protein